MSSEGRVKLYFYAIWQIFQMVLATLCKRHIEHVFNLRISDTSVKFATELSTVSCYRGQGCRIQSGAIVKEL
jgi:hypothetical protein